MMDTKEYEKLLKIMINLRMAESGLAETLARLHQSNTDLNDLLVKEEK